MKTTQPYDRHTFGIRAYNSYLQTDFDIKVFPFKDPLQMKTIFKKKKKNVWSFSLLTWIQNLKVCREKSTFMSRTSSSCCETS